MTLARYEGDWINRIYLIIICSDYRIERTIERDDDTIAWESRHPYTEGTTPEGWASYYKACGYKEIVGLAEYEAEIRAMEGQEQLVAEHIEEIERSAVA